MIPKNIFIGKKAIIFDFDGTIADTFALHEAAFKEALKFYNLKFAYKDYLGMSTNEAIKQIFKTNVLELEEEEVTSLVKTKRLLANLSYQNDLRFIPGALDFIQLAHNHQCSLYIASSGSQMNVTAGLKALSIEQYFIDVITANDVTRSKPSPEIFEKILQKHKIDPDSAIVIEDAVSGIKAAVAAKIDVVCVERKLESLCEYADSVKFLSFSELIHEFKSYKQYEKSFSSHSNL